MVIIFKHIFRNIKTNMVRTILILFSLFGVGTLLSILFGILSICNSAVKLFINQLDFDYIVYSTNEKDIYKEKIEKLGFDFEYLGIREYNSGYVYNSKFDKYMTETLVGYDIEELNRMGNLRLDNKKQMVSLADDEVIISSAKSKNLKLKEGSSFIYTDEDGNEHELKIKYVLDSYGILNDSKNALIEAPDFISNLNTFMKIEGIDQMRYDYYLIKHVGNEKIENLTDILNDIEDDYGLDFVYFENINIYKYLDNYLKLGLLVIILIMTVVYFSINSVVKIILNERMPIVGTFRSLGASAKKMNLILLLEMGLYGFVGGTAGSILGVVLLKSLLKIFNGLFFYITGREYSFNGSLTIIIFTVLFLILFQILISITEILRISKISIKDTIFNVYESKYKYTGNKFLTGILFLIISAISFVFNRKLNFALSLFCIFSLVIALSYLLPIITKKILELWRIEKNPLLVMAKDTIINSKLQVSTNIIISVMLSICIISCSVANYFIERNNREKDLVQSDIYIFGDDVLSTFLDELLSTDGIRSASVLETYNLSSIYNQVTIANNDINDLTVIYSPDFKTLKRDSNLIEFDVDKANELKNNEVILSEVLGRRYNLKVGDTIVIKGIRNEEKFSIEVPINLKIVDFANTNGIDSKGIILSKNIVNKLHLSPSSLQYFVNVNRDVDISLLQKNIEKIDSTLNVYTKSEYRDMIITQVNDSNRTLWRLIIIITGIGLIGILSNQSVSFLQRKNILAVLYSTSMSRKQINRMILLELLLSYIFSTLTSILFAYLLLKIITIAIDILDFYLPLEFQLISILTLLLVIVLIFMIIYIVMKYKIKKMKIVEEIKYE